jgi:simple sugar transport system permease protein
VTTRRRSSISPRAASGEADSGGLCALKRLLASPEAGCARRRARGLARRFAGIAGSPFRSLEGTAAWLNAAAPLGILAVAVALLMIGGEFDLVGRFDHRCERHDRHAAHRGSRLAARCGDRLIALALGVSIGCANGILVVRTVCLPSSSRSALSSFCAA